MAVRKRYNEPVKHEDLLTDEMKQAIREQAKKEVLESQKKEAAKELLEKYKEEELASKKPELALIQPASGWYAMQGGCPPCFSTQIRTALSFSTARPGSLRRTCASWIRSKSRQSAASFGSVARKSRSTTTFQPSTSFTSYRDVGAYFPFAGPSPATPAHAAAIATKTRTPRIDRPPVGQSARTGPLDQSDGAPALESMVKTNERLQQRHLFRFRNVLVCHQILEDRIGREQGLLGHSRRGFVPCT